MATIPLPVAMEDLFKAVQRNAHKKTDKAFCRSIRSSLNAMCAAIAAELRADSCAVFYVDRDPHPEAEQQLIMRGATGNLAKTLRARKRGCIYSSRIEEVRGQGSVASTGTRQRRRDDGPGLTHVVWHCGLPRWANTRWEMERLRRTEHGGQGDQVAYPGQDPGTLERVFRNCVLVPIFAQGRVSPPLAPEEIRALLRTAHEGPNRGADTTSKWVGLDKQEETQHMRFLRNHRVIGVLKVENKRPRTKPEALPLPDAFAWENLPIAKSLCPGEAGKFSCMAAEQCPVGLKDLKARIQELGPQQVARIFWAQMARREERASVDLETLSKLEVAWGADWCQVCREMVDHCTKTFDATFSNEDVELLVALAMQLGRILPWRTIQYASGRDVILNESEVGALLICREDVDGLGALRGASRHVARHVTEALEQLKADLAFEEQSQVSMQRKWGLLEPRNPIRNISHRTKAYARLLRKAVLRHDEAWDKALKSRTSADQEIFTGQRLVRRLLGPKPHMYDIRDVAGVRVTCDYLSDADRVIKAICSRKDDWQVKIRDKQDMLEQADESGYRAIHLDLLVRAEGHVPAADIRLLKKLVNGLPELVGQGALWLPCELQIRTAYEDSWAKKSHNLVYKLDRALARVPKSLMDSLGILSSNLYEADRLSGIVREQILEFLTPGTRDEFHLLGLLGARLGKLPRHDGIRRLPAGPQVWPLRYMTFAMDCARQLYRHSVRYNGEAHYSHTVSIALELVRRFGLFPETEAERRALSEAETGRRNKRYVQIFALAMLHDCWLAATDEKGLIKQEQREKYWGGDCMAAFLALIKDVCSRVIETSKSSIKWRKLFGDAPPSWVVAFLDEYRQFWRGELGDIRRTSEQARDFWDTMRRRKPKQEDICDICRLRAAMLIDRLQELPDTPNKERRRERFRGAYGEFRHIRDRLSGIPGGSAITSECYKVMQQVAMRLGVEIPIHWYE